MRFFPPSSRFDEAEVRAKWLQWSEQNIKGNAAIRRAAAEAAVQTLARGGTVDQAVENAVKLGSKAVKRPKELPRGMIIVGGVMIAIFASLSHNYNLYRDSSPPPTFLLIGGVLLVVFGIIIGIKQNRTN